MRLLRTLQLQLRSQLARPATTLAICLMGLLGGCAAALVIVLFRVAIEHGGYLVGNSTQWQQPMSDVSRFVIPLVAVAIIYLLFKLTGFKRIRLGIPYVIHRMKQHYGILPWRSTLNQFFGGIIALIAGFSVGREGPAVHLGAASATWLGYHVDAPKNSIRTLAACGIAAAIAASFNTPLAAMVLVMEVVLREYKVHIFIPVMLAAVAGSLITEQIFGPTTEFAMLIPVNIEPATLPSVVLFGLLLGVIGVVFKALMLDVLKTVQPIALSTRLLFAGLITAILALLIPSSHGPGLSAIAQVAMSHPAMSVIFTLLFAKTVAAAVALGMGVPGGLIGSVFGIGAISAALFVSLLSPLHWMPVDSFDTFILLGMAGMLAASIHAPLAALLAIVELSGSIEVVIPAMLVIVPAYLVSNQLFRSKSIFIAQLELQDLPYQIAPVTIALQKTGVEAVMEREFKLLLDPTQEELLDALETAQAQSVVVMTVNENNQPEYRMVSYDIAAAYGENPSLNYLPLQGLRITATLSEVYDILSPQRRGAVYIYDQDRNDPLALVTWETVRKALQRELA